MHRSFETQMHQMKKITLALSLTFILISSTLLAQNVGIGTTSPIVKLDVAGRLRLQHVGATAGIFFDGTSTPQRSFIGTIDNDHVGIFGAVTGWKFAFNVTNGNVGIGISTPTATLDVNGSLRIRQNGATLGSSLHASDALGNTEWVAPVAFRVLGYSYGAYITFNHNTWTDINFGTNISYNLGNGYTSANSEFTAPQKGIYHFKSQLYLTTPSGDFNQRLMMRRNGNTSGVSVTAYDAGNEQFFGVHSSLLDVELALEAGDAVWIEAIASDFSGTTQRQIWGNSQYTWWSGRLVQPL
jgi:hypothetical protein